MTIGELIKTLERIPNKNLPVPDAVALMAQHPNLPVVAMVDAEVVADDIFCRWYGSLGRAYIDDVCAVCDKYQEPKTFLKSYHDADEIFEDLWSYEECGIDIVRMCDEDIERMIKEKVDSLPWKKCICINVDTPDLEPFDKCAEV